MKKTDYMIRPAGFNDAERIFELVQQYPEELLPRPISDIVQNIDRFLVCDAGTEIIGTVAWKILPEIGAPTNPSVEIQSLSVKRGYQRTGAGTALIGKAIERIMELEPAQIIVLTFSPDFFRQFGFKETPKEKLMHKIYMGCINCTKYQSPFTCPEVAMALNAGAVK